jgi:hypothetical protein
MAALTSVRNQPGWLWHVDLLLGNDRESSNYTTAFAKQLLGKQACFHGSKRMQ